MSAEGLKKFIETAKRDVKLNDEFTAAAAAFARKQGFDVDAADVREFIDRLPQERAPGPGTNPIAEQRARDWDDAFYPDEPVATTMALGEEGNPPRGWRPGNDNKGDAPAATTQAVGEEEKPGRVTSQALGEEDKPRVSVTQAIGEEDRPRPPVTTMAVGEEGKNPRPPRP